MIHHFVSEWPRVVRRYRIKLRRLGTVMARPYKALASETPKESTSPVEPDEERHKHERNRSQSKPPKQARAPDDFP